MLKRRVLIFVALVSVILSAVTPMLVLAANSVLSVALNSGSCSAALALIDITLDSAAVREGGQVALSDGTVLTSFEISAGALGTSYSGTYGFGSWTAVPDGTSISLYGYIGQTPPSASDSVEFFVAYRCDTGEVLATCGGPAGSCPKIYSLPGGVCLNTLDGRLNNSGAFDCAAPIVLFNNDGRLDVYGVGGGESTLLFSIQDADISSGGVEVLDNTSIPATGKPVRATRQGDGSLLLEAFYEDGKPYTIIYTPGGSPITHVAW